MLHTPLRTSEGVRDNTTPTNTLPTPNSPLRYGLMFSFAASAVFTLWRAQSSVSPIVAHEDALSNTWFSYKYPPSYYSMYNQSQDFIASMERMARLVEEVEQVGACSPYRVGYDNPKNKQERLFHATIYQHQAACKRDGVTDLTQELAEVQRKISRNFSLSNPPLQQPILSAADEITADSVPLSLTTIASDSNSIVHESPVARRKLFELVDETGFDEDLRDTRYGVHLWCYLIPGNLVKGKTNLGWPCSVDASGWWVLAGNDRAASDKYFDNAQTFYNTVASWKIQYLDCLGHVQREEPEPRSDVQNKVISEALELRMIKCIQGAFSTLNIAHTREGSWVLINPTGKLAYPISECAHFFAGGFLQLYPNIFNGAGIYFYVRSLVTGVGPKIGKMYPECNNMVTSKWSAPYCADTAYLNAVHSGQAYLQLEPESNQACDDYRASMQQLETDLAQTKHNLEQEGEDVKERLEAYQQQYQTLKQKQEALMRQYQKGEKSIASILQDLATIQKHLAVFNQALADKKKTIAEELRAAEERAEKERKRLAANQSLSEKLAHCQKINLDIKSLHASYTAEISQAFEAIQSQMQQLMKAHTHILQALQGQQPIETREVAMTTMEEERKQDVIQQQALKSQYIADQAERLELLLNTTLGSETRQLQLQTLHESDQAIFDQVNTINVRSTAREQQYAEWRTLTEYTTQTLEAEIDTWQQQLTAFNATLLQVDAEIATKQQFVQDKRQELDNEDKRVAECFQEALAMQQEHEADISKSLQEDLQEATRLRKELEILDQEEKIKSALQTQESITQERQKIQDELEKYRHLVNQTAHNVYQKLDNAKALDTALAEGSHNFTTMMNDQNKERQYQTM